MEIPMNISISRVHCSDGDDYIKVSLEDEKSGITFAVANVPMKGFAECLTGLSYVDCEGEVMGLDNVGKTMESDKIEFEIYCSGYGDERKDAAKKEVEKYLKKHLKGEGWESSNYFGSQDSFFNKDGKQYAQTTIRRYV
jgi:hypothetical protein